MFASALVFPIAIGLFALWTGYREMFDWHDILKVVLAAVPSSALFTVVGFVFRMFRLPKQREFEAYQKSLNSVSSAD